MAELGQFITNAAYVTFCTASIGFGALYFRKVVDDLALREVHLGEELHLEYDPKAFAGIGIFAFFFCIFVFILSLKSDLTHEEMNMSAPGLVLMVVPMVLVTNMIQLFLRARWQRTSIRTGGILIRRMLSERRAELSFAHSSYIVVIEREFLWFRLVFRTANDEELSHCSVSAAGLRRIVRSLRAYTDWHLSSTEVDVSDSIQNDLHD